MQEEEKRLPNAVRLHAVARLLHDFFQPLSVHIALESKISLLMRTGYLGRNPKSGSFYEHLQSGYERLVKGDLNAFSFGKIQSTAQSLAFIGCSGCGKTTALERILETYPTAVFHPEYNITQLPYLKLDCPHDGTLKSLCFSFFQAIDNAIDTDYVKRYGSRRLSLDVMLARMAQLANFHAIGVLVIDEIQHLKEAKSGGIERMLNFFVTLINTIGVPVIMVGTPWARRFFENDLRSARRATGMGSLMWDRMPKDNQWDGFVRRLLSFQWLRGEPLAVAAINDKLYDLTQGVIDITVKLFALAQHRAIVTGVEQVTLGLLEQVYSDEFIPVHPMISALRSGKAEQILKYGDLRMPDVSAKVLDISQHINTFAPKLKQQRTRPESKTAKLVEILCSMGIEQDVAMPLVDEVMVGNSELPIATLVHMMTRHMAELSRPAKRVRKKRLSKKDWDSLEGADLRAIFSQRGENTLYDAARQRGLVLDLTQGLVGI